MGMYAHMHAFIVDYFTTTPMPQLQACCHMISHGTKTLLSIELWDFTQTINLICLIYPLLA